MNPPPPSENPPPPSDDYDFNIGKVERNVMQLRAFKDLKKFKSHRQFIIEKIDKTAFQSPSNSASETELSSDEGISAPSNNNSNSSTKPQKLSLAKQAYLLARNFVIAKNSPVDDSYNLQYNNFKLWCKENLCDSFDLENDKSKFQSKIPLRDSGVLEVDKSNCQEKKPLHDSDDLEIVKFKSGSKKPLHDSADLEDPKSKSWGKKPLPGSADLENDKSKSLRRKDSYDSDDRSKTHHKKYLDESDNRLKSRHKKHSNDRRENRSKSHRKEYSVDSEEEQDRFPRKNYPDDSDEDYYHSNHSRNYDMKYIKQEKKYSDDSEEERYRFPRKKYSDNSDDHYSSKYIKEEEVEKKESKYTPGLSSAFNNFHCRICDIVVNSESTYQTHIRGKKHQKAVKAKAVPEMAMSFLKEPRIPFRIPPPISDPPRIERIKLKDESLIQRAIDDYKDDPVPGLSDVVEILPVVKGVKEISYFCKLCEAPCVPNTIMKHLTGFKHYLRCLEKIDPVSYERHRYTPKRQIEGKVRHILLQHENRNGRGRISVEKELAAEYPQSRWDEPGPSSREEKPLPPIARIDGDDEIQMVSAMQHLDTSMGDFHCTVCDSHMNNQAMWESHVRGKRHLKNIKKVPGESTSKIKSIHCPDETAHLMQRLEVLSMDEYGNCKIIVGLDFIRELQGEGGITYNCFLCGACPTSFDIIDHLLLIKHKTRYLEEMNTKGYPNDIEQIKEFSGFSARAKENLINDECLKSVEKYGEGKVAVYKSKNLFLPSYGPYP